MMKIMIKMYTLTQGKHSHFFYLMVTPHAIFSVIKLKLFLKIV